MVTRRTKAALKPTDAAETQKQAIKEAAPGVVLTHDVPVIGAGRLSGIMGAFPGTNFISGLNPDLIDFGTYDRMRGDSVIRAALTLIKAPVLGQQRQATAVSSNPKIQAFLKHTIIESGFLYRTMRTSLRAIDFGIAAHEKIWEVKNLKVTYKTADKTTGEEVEKTAWDGPAFVYKELKEVNPSTIKRIVRRGMDPYGLYSPTVGYVGDYTTTSGTTAGKKANDGSYDGFIQVGYFGLMLPGSQGPEIHVPAQKSYIYTHDLEFGNLWGRPRTKDAYPYFFWKQQILKFWMSWAEKKVVPPRIARFPIGRDPKSGLDNGQIAINTLVALDNNAGVALPSSHIRDAPGVSRRLTESDWDIKELQVTDKSDTFDKIFTTLNTEILRAMFVPERTFTQGDVGAYAMAKAHTDTFLMTLDSVLVDVMEAFNRWVIQPLVLVNFGPQYIEDAKIVVPGITDEEREFVRTIFSDLVINPTLQYRIDFDAIAERFSVPLKDPELRDMPQPEQGLGGGGGLGSGFLPPEAGIGEPDHGGGPEETPEPDATANTVPANVVLTDADEEGTYLALAGFDAERWTITPDSNARLGYRVIDNNTGLRLGGFAAFQVIKSWQQDGARQAKTAQTAANTAARKAAADAKRNQAVNARAQRVSQTASRQAQAAEQKAQREANKQQRSAAGHAAAAQTGAGAGAGARGTGAANVQHEHNVFGTTQDSGGVGPGKTLKLPVAKGVKPVHAAAAKVPKTPKAVAPPKHVVAAVRQQKAAVQTKVAKLPTVHAAKAIKAAGFSLRTAEALIGKQEAIDQAVTMAKVDLNNIYTIVKTADGWTVISKPRTYLHTFSKNSVSRQALPTRHSTTAFPKPQPLQHLTEAELASGEWDEAAIDLDETVVARLDEEQAVLLTDEPEDEIDLTDVDLDEAIEDEPLYSLEERDEMLKILWQQALNDIASYQQERELVGV